jgi:hypothetical protein
VRVHTASVTIQRGNVSYERTVRLTPARCCRSAPVRARNV